MELSGAVIAGGKSRRMGHDKRVLVLEGEPLLARAVALLRRTCEEVLFVAPEPPPFPLDAEHVRDRFEGMGVLAGIHAALEAARGGRVLCIPADTPLLSARWLQLLEAGCRESGLPCVPRIGGRVHPIPGCYPKSLYTTVDAALRAGHAAAKHLFLETGARFVEEEEASAAGCGPSELTNVNTPEDWESLLASLDRTR